MSERTSNRSQTDKSAQADAEEASNSDQWGHEGTAERQSRAQGRKRRTRGVAGLLGDYNTTTDQQDPQEDEKTHSAQEDTDRSGEPPEPDYSPAQESETETDAEGETERLPNAGETAPEVKNTPAGQSVETEATPESADSEPEDSHAHSRADARNRNPKETAIATPNDQPSPSVENAPQTERSRHESKPEQQAARGPAQYEGESVSGNAPSVRSREAKSEAAPRETDETGMGSQEPRDVVEEYVSARAYSRPPIPEGGRSPMARDSGERVVKVSYYVPEDHTFVLDEMRAQLKRKYRYSPRQASQSNLIALAIERLYEDLMGEPFTDEADKGSP